MSNLKMPQINNVTLAGRLTRDPELKYLPSGQAICEFGIAVERVWYDKAGQKQSKVYFDECQYWGDVAEKFAGAVGKGRAVYVEGELTLDEWEDKQSGQKRSKTRINVRRVQALDWPQDGNGQGGAPPPQQRRQPAAAQRPVPQSAASLPEYEPTPDEEDIPF